jgi:hypothetical protein
VLAAAIQESGVLRQWQRDGRLIGDRNEDWRAAVQLLRDRIATDRLPIFVRSGFLEANRLPIDDDPLLRDYCLAPVSTIYHLGETEGELTPLPTADAGALSDAHLATIQTHHGAWFIVHGSQRSRRDIAQTVLSVISRQGMTGDFGEHHEFGNVGLSRLELARP